MKAIQILGGWISCSLSIESLPGWLAVASIVVLAVQSVLWADEAVEIENRGREAERQSAIESNVAEYTTAGRFVYRDIGVIEREKYSIGYSRGYREGKAYGEAAGNGD